jgi:folate-binding protein YgfZ
MPALDELSAAARDHAVAHVTNDRVVHVRGEDARSWLSGQVTADLKPLTPEHAVYALAVTVKGRIVTDLWIVERDEGLAMVLPERCADDALAALEKHIIMEDVELVPAPSLRVVSVQGPSASEVLGQAGLGGAYGAARLSEAGLDLWLDDDALAASRVRLEAAVRAAGGTLVDDARWDGLHVALGVPRAGVDFNADAYPQEAGLKARAVAFNKGCYLGQEVVYMLENRGQLARRLVQLRGAPSDLAAGTPLLDADGKRVGQLTSWTALGPGAGVGLGYAKKPSWEVGQELHAGPNVLRITHVVGAGFIVCPVVAS